MASQLLRLSPLWRPSVRLLSYSYAHGTSTWPLVDETLGQLLDRQAERIPDSEAFVVRHQAIRKNFSQLRADAERVAAGLLKLGYVPGERVGIWSTNNYEWLALQYAAAKAGLVLVNVNPANRAHELAQNLRLAQVKGLVMAPGFRGSDYLPIVDAIAPGVRDHPKVDATSLRVEQLPNLRHLVIIDSYLKEAAETPAGMLRFSELSQMGGRDEFERLERNARRFHSDMALGIQFTSGTTGTPKGATLSHHSVINNAYSVGRRLRFNEEIARICCSVPFYHIFGCVVANIVTVAVGGTAIVPCDFFDVSACLDAIEEERCTALYGVPTMFNDFLRAQHERPRRLDSLRTGIIGAAPCPAPLLSAVIEQLHLPELVVMYGSTELSPVITATYHNDNFERRLNTVGRPLDHCEVKIVDSDGCTLPVGERGEVLGRGYGTMLGYWDEAEKTREAIGDARWYRTGDIGVMRPDGYLQIVGRAKDLIIRGGENVYPAEIEACLLRHEDVAEAHVIGVPDERLGEEICAWVRLKTDSIADRKLVAARLRQFVHDELASFKAPRFFLLFGRGAPDAFPLTVSGKVQKFRMREHSTKKRLKEEAIDSLAH